MGESENLLKEIVFTDDFNELKEWKIKKYEILTESLIDEAYGSFPGQYKSVKNLIDVIFNKKENNEYINNGKYITITAIGNIDGIGKINLIVNWENNSNINDAVSGKQYIDKNLEKNVVLNVKSNTLSRPNLATTMAHEIMHCFQQKLPNVNGVNLESMILYSYLLQFQKTYENFSHFFFYGMYITYSFEMAANVSSVSSFIGEYFKDRNKNEITTNEYLSALEKCDKYNAYVEVLNWLANSKPNSNDIDYIKKCMTGTFKNMFGEGEEITLYNPETFNVEAFIYKTKQDIIKKCQETIEKMHINIMNFLEN